MPLTGGWSPQMLRNTPTTRSQARQETPSGKKPQPTIGKRLVINRRRQTTTGKRHNFPRNLTPRTLTSQTTRQPGVQTTFAPAIYVRRRYTYSKRKQREQTDPQSHLKRAAAKDPSRETSTNPRIRDDAERRSLRRSAAPSRRASANRTPTDHQPTKPADVPEIGASDDWGFSNVT